jgi:membrane protein
MVVPAVRKPDARGGGPVIGPGAPVPAPDAVRQTLTGLADWPWLETAKVLRQRFREDRLALTAGSLTFTTLIGLVPLLTVMLALFTAFPVFASLQRALETYFLQSLVPPSISKPVLAALTQFAARASQLGGAGLVVLVVTALALMLTIDRTLNGIWRVRRPRPIAQRVLVYWAALTLGPLALGISLSLTSYAISASRGIVETLPGGVTLLLDGVQFMLITGGVAGLFRFVPNTHVPWRHALAGGLFVAVGLELAQRGLGLYLALVPGYSAIYGAFATVPIFLVWLFVSWVIVLLGAVLAAYAPTLRLGPLRQAGPGQPFELALAALRLLRQARLDGAAGLGLQALAARLAVEPLRLEPVLEVLVRLDWVGRLDEEGDPRHALLCDPERVPVQPVVAQLLLAPSADVLAFWRHAGFGRLTLAEALASAER